jgi:hypothetical protein
VKQLSCGDRCDEKRCLVKCMEQILVRKRENGETAVRRRGGGCAVGHVGVPTHITQSMNICKPHAALEEETQGQSALLILPFFCFKSCVSFVVISSLSCSISRPIVFNFCLSSGISS